MITRELFNAAVLQAWAAGDVRALAQLRAAREVLSWT